MLGFTIDSITLFVSHNDFGVSELEYLSKKLKDLRSLKRNKEKGWKVGYYKNFQVKYHLDYGIYISGSISNYAASYNNILSYSQFPHAIEKLGKELGLSLHTARLYRVDLALNIEVDNTIQQYSHSLFSDLPHFERLEQSDGVRFETDKIRIAIYNKSKEVWKRRNIKIAKDILRIEFRVMKGLPEVLGIKNLRIEHLFQPEVYGILLDKFSEYYYKIKKSNVVKSLEELNNITPKQFGEYSWVLNMTEVQAYRMIEQLGKEGKFKSSQDKSRCRKMVREIFSNLSLVKPHHLVEELDRKVENYLLTEKKLKKYKINFVIP